MVRFLLSALLLCLPAIAQKPRAVKPRPSVAKPGATIPAPPATRWPIATLAVQGNKNYSTADILAISGLKIGDHAGKAEFDAARDRLLATGAFESVGYRFDPLPGGDKGYAASLQVAEIVQVYPFRFESIHVDTKALTEHLRQTIPLFSDKLPGTKQMLDRITKSVEEWMAKSGQKEQIVAKLASSAPGKLEIVIQPSFLPAVAELDFSGNKAISTQQLREAVAGPAVGAVYTEPKFREILDNSARPQYEAIGRLRVEWTKIEAVPAKGVKGLAVNVQVSEGDEFKLRHVEIAKPDTEDKAAFDERALVKVGAFETDQVANFKKIQAGIRLIEQSLRKRGYLEVKSKMDRTIDDAAKTVDLKLTIDPGPLFTFGQLQIKGLDIESEPVIRKLWAMKKGQPFDVEYPDFFLDRIRTDGIFDNLGRTKSIVDQNGGTGTVDVTLVFEGEKRPEKPDRP
jgi:outer membrane protein insertion porin family